MPDFNAKMHQNRFRLRGGKGRRQEGRAGKGRGARPVCLLVLRGVKGREGEGEREGGKGERRGREGKGRGGKREGKEEREGRGKGPSPPRKKILAPPLARPLCDSRATCLQYCHYTGHGLSHTMSHLCCIFIFLYFVHAACLLLLEYQPVLQVVYKPPLCHSRACLVQCYDVLNICDADQLFN